MCARPRTVRDEEILEAANGVAGAHGVAGLTLAAVAGAVGLSPATLLQRFGSKRGLLHALAVHNAQAVRPVLAELRAGHASPLDALRALPGALYAHVATPQELANHLSLLQLDLRDAALHAHAAAHAAALHAGIRALLEAAVAAGELPAQDTAALARAVQTALNGSLVLWAIAGQGAPAAWVRKDLAWVLRAAGGAG